MSEVAIFFAEKVEQLEQIVVKLQSENDFLKRHIFGKKSERFITTPGQLSLEGLDVQVPDLPVSKPEVAEPVEKEKQKPVRKALDESKFEVIVEELQPEGNLDEMKFIGVEESTHQMLVDAKIVLKKIKRY